jgi:hypothetical protein
MIFITPALTTATMVYCTECGAEVSGMGSYCPECGAKIESAESKEHDEDIEDENEYTDIDTEESAQNEESSFDIKHAVIAVAIGFIPALGLYIMTSVAFFDPIPAVLLVGIVLFGYLLYRRPTAKSMVGGASFWLAIESFLTPLALLIYTFSFAAQETQTGAGQAGAAIGGFVLVIAAFVIGVPLGIVFYLVSKRLDVNNE